MAKSRSHPHSILPPFTLLNSILSAVIGTLILLLTLHSPSSAQTVTDLYSFTGRNSSVEPSNVTPTQGRDGSLFGTTETPNGTIFKVATTGTFRQLDVFSSATGDEPNGGVTLASNGNFYGTTSLGGSSNYGALFKVTPTGSYSVLHEFAGGTDGALPASPPIQASDGNLYGTTYGNTTTSSTIYKYAPASGGYSTIYQFNSAVGSGVIASLTQASNGKLYGTAYAGGANNCGSIFELTTSGTLLWSYSFPCAPGGANPVGPLLQAADGNFYGTASAGGSTGHGAGVVFKLDQSSTVSVLYNFVGFNQGVVDGASPFGGLVQGTDGNLYGTTLSGGSGAAGTLFQITTGGNYKLLYSFTNPIGSEPRAALLQDTNGLFYGTASGGGKFRFGSVFSLNMGLGPFVTFVRPSGTAGGTAQILGEALTGATSVTFNGIPATSFKVVADTYMTAVVPSGATTGPVVVTTLGGPLTSNKKFQIIGGTTNIARGKRAQHTTKKN